MRLFGFKRQKKINKISGIEIVNNNKTTFVIDSGPEKITSRSLSNIQADVIVLPDTIKTIDSSAFYGNQFVKEIVLPNTITTIGDSAFHKCINLEKINLPDSIINLSECCFYNCSNLKEIKLPKKLKHLPSYCFRQCDNLKKVEFNDELESIGNFAFNNCTNLDNLELPNSVTRINFNAFANCKSIKKLILSKNLKIIDNDVFYGCESLTTVEIPNSVQEINTFAFANCSKLNKIIFPPNINKIGSSSFQHCKSLEEIYIKTNDEISIEPSAFSTCSNLKKVFIKTKNRYSIDLDLSGFTNIRFYFEDKNVDRLNNISKTIKNHITVPFSFAKTLIKYNQDLTFIEGNFKGYKRLKKLFLKNADSSDEIAFLLICYNLGVFHYDKDISNKSTVFIEEILSKKLIPLEIFLECFEKMDLRGYKKEYSDFIMQKSNFKQMFALYNEGYDIFSESYNFFEFIQEYNLSKNVHHRQLAPTVEKCKEFLVGSKFNNVTEKTKKIAEEVGKFSNEQKNFELGVKIFEKFEKMKTATNYEDLEIEKNPFENINAIEKEILKTNKNSLHKLDSIINNKYNFEWLRKNDPKNLMLGYYCSSCAHIDGMGESIMVASIVHPNTRNLVIKNECGKIVAKFTLYVNEKKGYGIFNTASISDSFIITDDDKRNMVKLLLKGTNSYVVAYNKKNPNNKITQINIGNDYNKLSSFFSEFNIHKTEVLPNLNYKKYSKNFTYAGDADKGQYCVFKLEDNNEKLQ